jgi:hypothetical protein
MPDLGMKLNSVNSSSWVFNRSVRGVFGMGDSMKPGGKGPNLISVAHPDLEPASLSPEIFEKLSPLILDQLSVPVLPLFGMDDLPSQQMADQLHPVTNPKDRDA